MPNSQLDAATKAPLPCPCQSGVSYDRCCQPLHQGANCASAEALMRSRYSAHALKLTPYILASWADQSRDQVDPIALQQWLDSARFTGLNVIECTCGDAEDDNGTVEFEAFYLQDQQLHRHHELAHFCRDQGQWRYLSSQQPRRALPHLSRNQLCPCASGRKLKHCCINRLAE